MALHITERCQEFVDGSSSSSLALVLSVLFSVYTGLSIIIAALTIQVTTQRTAHPIQAQEK